MPIVIDEQQIDDVRATLPELPPAKTERFVREYGIAEQDIKRLVLDRARADYFEACLQRTSASAQTVANWINGVLASAINKNDLTIETAPVSVEMLSGLLDCLLEGVISAHSAREIFTRMWEGEGDAVQIIKQQGLRQMDDSAELERIIDQVIEKSPKQVMQYKSGKEKIFGYFVGQVMQITKGKANPQQVNELLKNKLS